MQHRPSLFAQTQPSPLAARGAREVRSARSLWAAALLAGALATTAVSSAALAQESPDTFTLPEGTPSPTPTPAPQGPADERSGVPIAPRLIDPERTRPAPAEEAEPERADAQPPQPTPGSPSLEDAFTAAFPEGDGQAEPVSGEAGEALAPSALSPQTPVAASTSGSPQSTQASETPADTQGGLADQIGAQSVNAAPNSGGSARGLGLRAPPKAGGFAALSAQLLRWALIALVLALVSALVWWAWRQRLATAQNAARDATNRPSQDLHIESLKEVLAEERAKPASTPAPSATTKPRPAPAPLALSQSAHPPRLSLGLAIISAQRSVMRFTVEYKLTVTNRSAEAVRDLAIRGRLACAKAETSQPAAAAHDRLLGEIERIGPQQAASLEGALELPIADIRMMRQGSIPAFVPLMHVAVERAGLPVSSTRFVIGQPSEHNRGRLHPIALNTQIGGIRGLRADLVQPFTPPGQAGDSAR